MFHLYHCGTVEVNQLYYENHKKVRFLLAILHFCAPSFFRPSLRRRPCLRLVLLLVFITYETIWFLYRGLSPHKLCLMKITLDHNCIIDLELQTKIGGLVGSIVANPSNACFVVNIGASEMRERGVRPDNYKRFEELLVRARIDHLPRINPMFFFDVTFWDRCVWSNDKEVKLAKDIESVLFGNAYIIDIEKEGIDSQAGRKWLNRTCDIHSLWCHIQNGNDIFLTTDGNFTKTTKLPKLIALGAKRICHPREL
jgi:hypothetical protein